MEIFKRVFIWVFGKHLGVKASVANADDPSSIPSTHSVRVGKNQLLKTVLLPPHLHTRKKGSVKICIIYLLQLFS